MAARNDITGDSIKTRAGSSSYQAYSENYDRIFGKKKTEETSTLTFEELCCEIRRTVNTSLTDSEILQIANKVRKWDESKS